MKDSIPEILILPPWQDKVHNLKAPKIPESIHFDELPELYLHNGDVLPIDAVKNFVGILCKSDLKTWMKPLTDDSFKSLLSSFNAQSLNKFGKELYDATGVFWVRYAWLWCMDNESVEEMHQIFASGNSSRDLIRILAINYQYTESIPALTELFFLLHKGKKRNRNFVQDLISDIYIHANLNIHELYDLTIPDLEFDSSGSRLFQFGMNTIKIKLDNHLSPILYNDNRIIKSLPRITNNDDKTVWQQTKLQVTDLKKSLNKFYKQHEKRLVQDFETQVFRKYHHFIEKYLANPLLNLLAQTVVWGVFKQSDAKYIVERKKNFVTEFIIGTDGVWLDHEYDDVKKKYLSGLDKTKLFICPIHPAYLDKMKQDTLSHMLTEFEITQSFSQMNYPVFDLTNEEKIQNKIKRFSNQAIAGDLLREFCENDSRYSVWERTGSFYGITFSDEDCTNINIVFTEKVNTTHTSMGFISWYQDFYIHDIDISNCNNKKLINDVIDTLTHCLVKQD